MKWVEFSNGLRNLHYYKDIKPEVLKNKGKIEFKIIFTDHDNKVCITEKFSSEEEMNDRYEEIKRIITYKPRPFIPRRDNFGNKSFNGGY